MTLVTLEALLRVALPPLKLVLRPGMSEPELAASYARAAAELYPMVDPLLSNLLALHLRHSTQAEVVSALERSGGKVRYFCPEQRNAPGY